MVSTTTRTTETSAPITFEERRLEIAVRCAARSLGRFGMALVFLDHHGLTYDVETVFRLMYRTKRLPWLYGRDTEDDRLALRLALAAEERSREIVRAAIQAARGRTKVAATI